jgi:hypothetical protein
MGFLLTLGKALDITLIGEQYELFPGNRNKGLLKTKDLYDQNKDPHGEYNFGKLTELYFDLQGNEKAHWRQSVATFAEIHRPLKAVIKAALTHQPDPLEIRWNWDEKAEPIPGVNKGVSILFDAVAPKYFVLIFGYTMPA